MQARTQPIEAINQAEALRFLQALGKDPAAAWFRSIRHGKGANHRRKGADLHGFDAAELEADSRAGSSLYMVIGEADTCTGTAISDSDITICPALFAEWDSGTAAEQQAAIEASGLPEPSILNHTGGKSLHAYWLLQEPISPEQWKEVTARLIAHTGADPKCCNPSRVMRLPGSTYYDKKTGRPTGTASIISAPGTRYQLAQLVAELAVEQTNERPRPATPARNELPPRQLQEIEAAAQYIPERVVGGDTYETSRRALCGCAAALAEIGLPEAQALDLLAGKWPDRATAEQALNSSSTRNPAAFWAIAKQHGFDLSRKLKVIPGGRSTGQPGPPPAGSDAGAKTKPTPDGIEAYLRQEISEGISEANLATLITTLSLESDIHASTIQQIANRLKDEHRRKLEVQAEAQAIAAEADRQELGQALTPAYILPPAIAAAIQIRTRYLPCDGPSAVLPFLTAAAGLVKLGTQVQASAAAGYSVPINLNSCLVGKSGAMKSPVGRLTVEAPTQELQAELARANQLDHSQWEETCKELKKGEPRPAKPRPKRLKVSDFTGEALADQLQTQEAHGLGLLIHRDELSGLFGSLNAYRGGKGGDEQQLLELFDGGGLNSLRVMGDRHYSRSQVSIYGSTQPDVLRQLVAEGDASGLWARFLFVPLPERPVQLPITTSVAEVAEVDAAAETLANVCRSIYTMPPQTYHLSPAAAEQFARYHYSRQQAALAAATGAESALYGKSAGKVLRVAGVLHLLQIATGQASKGDRIEPPTIDRATALVDHLDAWALSFHAEVAAGGIGQLMRTVHTASEATAGPVRWTDLQRRLSKSQRKEIDSAAAADAMQALAAAGYGEVEQLRNRGLSYRAIRPLP